MTDNLYIFCYTDIVFFMQVANPLHEQLRNDCTAFSDLIVEPRALLIDGNPNSNPLALRSAIILDGPAVLQENFLAYQNTLYSINQINRMLTKWRELFFQVINCSY